MSLPPSTKQTYERREVCRLLGISERQLKSWEKQGLIPPAETFAFSDILALKTLQQLRRDKVPATQIRRALVALTKKMRHAGNPLTELKLYADGNKIRVRVDGREMEPVSGQLLLDFDQTALSTLLAFPKRPPGNEAHRQKLEADRWFEKGLDLEQRGAPIEEVILAYQKATALDPTSAGALVNLGTIFFTGRAWDDAEQHYRRALAVDPDYPLAHFNLGNLYDERGDRTRALFHYQAALRLHANYADAHYNIALLYQANGQAMEAVRHWKMYLKLDPASRWAGIARRELEKLREAALIKS